MPRRDTHLTGYTALRGRIREPQLIARYPLGATKCTRVWTADIDQDGELDILAADADGLLAATSKGRGKWRAQTSNMPVVAVTDLDGDGTREIVLRGPEVRSAWPMSIATSSSTGIGSARAVR